MSKIIILATLALLFSLSSCTYWTSLAHDLAHLESITYQTQSAIDSWSCAECSNYQVRSQQSFFSSTANIQGYGAYVPKYQAILIAFRGSVDVTNWLYNLNTVTTSYPGCSGCNVHQGFYSAYKGVAPLVRNLAQTLLSQYRDAKVIITGHSLGGAMAALCALDIKELFGRVDYLYSFGQPRVGNQNFANHIQSQIPSYTRIINFADTVPHVPQSILGFKHGGTQIWYTPRGMKTFKLCPTSQDKSCSNSVSLTSMSTQDHGLAYYMTLEVVNLEKERIVTKQEILSEFYTEQEVQQAEFIKVEKIKALGLSHH